ncbi:Hypothetical predicted protein [Marmota monax]|uniref:Thyroglobulin type-1 domain-containing protein n=1 Tax=Marmota monax TaxID=9995 RepID=A0A5E4AIV5_MARMO|nr:Hypothetical predicted protein [Marmota monax]
MALVLWVLGLVGSACSVSANIFEYQVDAQPLRPCELQREAAFLKRADHIPQCSEDGGFQFASGPPCLALRAALGCHVPSELPSGKGLGHCPNTGMGPGTVDAIFRFPVPAFLFLATCSFRSAPSSGFGLSSAKMMAAPVGVWVLMAGKCQAAGGREGQRLVSVDRAPRDPGPCQDSWCAEISSGLGAGGKSLPRGCWCPGLSFCQLHKQQILLSGYLNSTATSYLPQCRDSGDYSPVQCDLQQVQCWCVDAEGMEVYGTRQLGRPTRYGEFMPVQCKFVNTTDMMIFDLVHSYNR